MDNGDHSGNPIELGVTIGKRSIISAILGAPNIRSQCRITILRSIPGFLKLRPEWDALEEKCDSTIFQTFEWNFSWWKHFHRSRNELRIICFHYQGKIVGIAPLYIEEIKTGPFSNVRVFRFIGHSDSDYLDFLIDPGYERIVTETFTKYLKYARLEWDLLDLRDFRSTSDTLPFLNYELERLGTRHSLYRGMITSSVTAHDGWDSVVASLSTTVRKDLSATFDQFYENKNLTHECLHSPNDDFNGGIDSLVSLNFQEMKSDGYQSPFEDLRLAKFHKEIAEKFSARSQYKLWFIRDQGKRIADLVGLYYRNRMYVYNCNIVTAQDSGPHAGLLIRALALKDALRQGITNVDFLRGYEAFRTHEWNPKHPETISFRTLSPTKEATSRTSRLIWIEGYKKSIERLKTDISDYKYYQRTHPEQVHFKQISFFIKKVSISFNAGTRFFMRYFFPSLKFSKRAVEIDLVHSDIQFDTAGLR